MGNATTTINNIKGVKKRVYRKKVVSQLYENKR